MHKAVCDIAAHKNNPWRLVTSSVSLLERFVFICVKGREDLVWTATTLPFETIERDWDRVKVDRCSLAQWQNFFDQLRGADGSGKHVEVALQAASDAAADICATGVNFPSKRAHSEMSPTPQNMGGAKSVCGIY